MKYTKIKEELKSLAKEIRNKKDQRGPSNSGFVPGLARDQYVFRHKHIAYCMLRGTPYELIEQPTKVDAADMELVEKYQEEFREAIYTSMPEAI